MKNISYNKQFLDKGDINEVVNSLKNKLITTGPYVSKFEKNISKYLNVKNAIACSSGTSAIYIAMRAINLSKNDYLFHAGTKYSEGQIISNGGRVLNFTSLGKNFLNIRNKIIFLIRKLNWKDGFFRKDIGWREIKKNANN